MPLITHAHPGHIGGALEGAGHSVFAQAHYYISQREWVFWTSESASEKAQKRFVAHARRSLEGIRE